MGGKEEPTLYDKKPFLLASGVLFKGFFVHSSNTFFLLTFYIFSSLFFRRME